MNIKNRQARFEYEILEEYTAGIILKGTEVKSIRSGDASIAESYIYEINGELWIKNMRVARYKNASFTNHDELRERKLLLNKREIDDIITELKVRGITLIPLEAFIINNKVKLKIAIVRGKNNYDKRNTIKERDLERESRRSL